MKKIALAAAIALASLAGTAANAQVYLGQLNAFSSKFCPQAWHVADGSLLLIQQNTALFALIGTTYGGNGETTFALPNLSGGTIGPRQQPITWCIAMQTQMPAAAPMRK